MTDTKPPDVTTNDDAAGTSEESPKPLPSLPEPEGCTAEEFLEAFPRMFENA
jgi:hypothetical protein